MAKNESDQRAVDEKNQDQMPLDDFEVFLRQRLHNNTPYITDAGFADAVMRALPQSKKRPGWLVVLASVLGFCVSIFALSALGKAAAGWAYTLNTTSLIQLGLLTSSVSLGVVLVWLSRELDWI